MKTKLLIGVLSIASLAVGATAFAANYTSNITNNLACPIQVDNGAGRQTIQPAGKLAVTVAENQQVAVYPEVTFQGKCTTAGIADVGINYKPGNNTYVASVQMGASNPGVVTKPFSISGSIGSQSYAFSAPSGGIAQPSVPAGGVTISVNVG